MRYLLALFCTILLSAVHAQSDVDPDGNPYEGCSFDFINGTFHEEHPHSLQCRVCGIEIGAEPIRCFAVLTVNPPSRTFICSKLY